MSDVNSIKIQEKNRDEMITGRRCGLPEYLPKVISEMVAIPCRESRQTGRFAPPFRNHFWQPIQVIVLKN